MLKEEGIKNYNGITNSLQKITYKKDKGYSGKEVESLRLRFMEIHAYSFFTYTHIRARFSQIDTSPKIGDVSNPWVFRTFSHSETNRRQSHILALHVSKPPHPQ